MFTKYRMPTIIGVLILIAGVAAGIFVVGQQQTALFPRAAPQFTPKQVRLTNISENGFSVSWITDEATSGFVKLGTAVNKLDQTFGDDRDQRSGSVSNNLTHHVTVRSLRPGTTYWFKIGSGSDRMLYDNQGQPYQVTMAIALGTPPAADTAYGTVMTAAGSPAKGTIVYAQLPGATPLSALVQDNGNWVISLSTARTSDLSSYVSYDDSTSLELLVQGGSGGTATAQVTTNNDSPVPTITLGKTHDFRQGSGGAAEPEATPSAVPSGGQASSQFSFLPVGEASETGEIALLNIDEGEVVTATQPAFLGKAPAGVTLTIKVESPQTYTGTVKVDADGTWDWTPPAGLEPGNHTITMSYTNDEGILQTIKRNFVVAASSGSGLPSFSASPSATATPSATASPSAKKSIPSTSSGVPQSGTLTPTLVIFIMGTALMALGMFGKLRYKYI